MWTHLELWFKPAAKNLLSRLITFRSPKFTHVELVLVEDDHYVGFSADGLAGGSRAKELDPSDNWVKVKLTDFYEGRQPFIDALLWVSKHINIPYDYLSLAELLLDKPPSDKAAFNCSQFCLHALQQAGYFLFLDPEEATPWDLFLMAKTREEVLERERAKEYDY
jgi:hypothetical protein